jgi:hypothetical protein
MSRISEYSFGHIVVDGEEHSRDLIVLPSRVVGEWWRRDGHSLVPEDLDEVMDELPERLIVGCGAYGRLQPHDLGRGEAVRRAESSADRGRPAPHLLAESTSWRSGGPRRA